MSMRLLLTLACAHIAVNTFSASSDAHGSRGQAEHVVVIVWDGMRPDFVTPQYCPTLYGLATNGVFFRRHHAAVVSSTEVNGTVLATGVNPGGSGVLANREYRPELNYLTNVAPEALDSVRRGDLLSGGKYIQVPTVAEILQDAGIPTIIAGAKPVAILHDRSSRKQSRAEKDSVTLFEGKTIPRTVAETLRKVNDDKAFPGTVTFPNTGQDSWTTRSLLRGLWKGDIPKYTLVWLSEPDKSQHENGVGSSNAVVAIESSDKNLAEVIKALKEKGVYDKTDIMVVSDHGFSTVSSHRNVAEILKAAGFTAGYKLNDPEPGDVLVVGLGGCVLLYVVDRQEAVIRRLVEFLQSADFTGVIFSRLSAEGAFPLESVGYSATNSSAPDVLISMRWSEGRNEYGAPGMVFSDDEKRNKGTHASLSRFDMNNTLVASGLDFKRAFISDTPSGNIDLAPTILWLLGVKPQTTMDGRVLQEALASQAGVAPKVNQKRIEATRELGLFRWTQYLKFSEVGGTVYFDEGNGEVTDR